MLIPFYRYGNRYLERLFQRHTGTSGPTFEPGLTQVRANTPNNQATLDFESMIAFD